MDPIILNYNYRNITFCYYHTRIRAVTHYNSHKKYNFTLFTVFMDFI